MRRRSRLSVEISRAVFYWVAYPFLWLLIYWPPFEPEARRRHARAVRDIFEGVEQFYVRARAEAEKSR